MSITEWLVAYLTPSALILTIFLLAMSIELWIGRLASRRRSARSQPAAASYRARPVRQRRADQSSVE
jgi:hypothetical protein